MVTRGDADFADASVQTDESYCKKEDDDDEEISENKECEETSV